MDKQSKLEYQQKVEKYLTDNRVYDLFEELLKGLVVKQPDNPINYMIDKLAETPTKKIFIVGPPGFKVRELALHVADHYKFTTVSVGDLLRKEVSKKLPRGQEIESYFKAFTFVRDDIVVQIVKQELENLQKEKKSFIIEGFPKTRVQALALQRAGIIPDAFVVLNLPRKRLEQSCDEKLRIADKMFDRLPEPEKRQLSANHCLEYTLNIGQVKDVYRNCFFEIDCTGSKEDTVEELARLLKFKIRPNRPTRTANILICGPPGSGRSSLGRALSKKYGFVYVSSESLLSDQIARKTEVGRIALNSIKNGQLVGDDIMNGLIHNRASQVDCHLQGYVLEGFPKTDVQISSLPDLKIQPTVVVVLECDQETSVQRLNLRRVDPKTGIIYDKSNPIVDAEVEARAVRQQNDNREIVEKRYKRWKDILKGMEKKYSALMIKVPSVNSVNDMVEKVSFHLQNN